MRWLLILLEDGKKLSFEFDPAGSPPPGDINRLPEGDMNAEVWSPRGSNSKDIFYRPRQNK